MTNYSKEQKREIYAQICGRLSLALDNESMDDNSTPMWKNILFLLDTYNEGDFFGVINLKILGYRMWDAEFSKRTFSIKSSYSEVDKTLEELGIDFRGESSTATASAFLTVKIKHP